MSPPLGNARRVGWVSGMPARIEAPRSMVFPPEATLSVSWMQANAGFRPSREASIARHPS